MRLAFLLVEDSYQHTVNRLLSADPSGRLPVEQSATQQRCQIALEIVAPGRHNDACSFINHKCASDIST
jgi:hypothetical protein